MINRPRDPVPANAVSTCFQGVSETNIADGRWEHHQRKVGVSSPIVSYNQLGEDYRTSRGDVDVPSASAPAGSRTRFLRFQKLYGVVVGVVECLDCRSERRRTRQSRHRADNGNRTRIYSLEGCETDHCPISAWMLEDHPILLKMAYATGFEPGSPTTGVGVLPLHQHPA